MGAAGLDGVVTQSDLNDDLAFARALAEGDPTTARAFERRYRPVIRHALGTALRRWRPQTPIEADDYVQDLIGLLFSDAGRRLRTYSGRAAFASWLYTVALRYFQRQLSRLRHDIRANPALAAMQVCANRTPEGAAIAAQEAARIRAAVQALPPAEQLYARLFFVEGLNASQVARTLGKGASAVRMRKMRLLERLRTMLAEPAEPAEPKGAPAQRSQTTERLKGGIR